MHVEDEGLAAEGAVDLREGLTIAEHAHVPHVDHDLAAGEALLGALRILRIAGIQVARLQAPDGLEILQTLHAAAQFLEFSSCVFSVRASRR